MKNVRIYKDDIREHVLRSLFFTDTVLAITGASIIAGIVFLIFHYVLHFFSWGAFGTTVLVSEIFFIGFITQKIDNQPIYKIVPRGLKFKSGKKDHRHSDLEPYFVDFEIQDNLIMRKNAIMKVYAVEPFDIALLNDQDREHFFSKLKQMIHVLPSQVQFIVRKEKASVEDYSKHFFSLYNSANTKREKLINHYIDDLSSLVTKHPFVMMHHYAVFSVPCDTKRPQEKVKAIKKVSDLGIRFASSLSACNIAVTPLVDAQLLHIAQTTLR
jgi:hypothetical protein